MNEVDRYISEFPIDTQIILSRIREIILESAQIGRASCRERV